MPSATTTSVTLSWTAPTRTGNSAISGYTARLYTTAQGNTVAAGGAASCVVTVNTCTITGLASGQTYSVQIAAANVFGYGPWAITNGGPVAVR